MGEAFLVRRGGAGVWPNEWNEKVEAVAYDDISKYDPVVYKATGLWTESAVRAGNFSHTISSAVKDISFARDYLAIAVGSSVSVFKRSDDNYTRISYLSIGYEVGFVRFTEDAAYLFVGLGQTVYISSISRYVLRIKVYKRNGDNFTFLTDIDVGRFANSGGGIVDMDISSDGSYIGVCGGSGATSEGYVVFVLKRTGESSFIDLNVSFELVYGGQDKVAISPDGSHLVYRYTSNAVLVYYRFGDTYVNIGNFSTPFNSGSVLSLDYSPDGNYLAVGGNRAPYLAIYKRSENSYTKLSDPSVLPSGNVYDATFSKDGMFLAVTSYSSPYVLIYYRDGDNFIKVSDPAILPIGTCRAADFSESGDYLIVGSEATPYLLSYKSSYQNMLHKIRRKSDFFFYSPPGWKVGMALENISRGQTGKAVLFPKLYNLPNT